MAMVSSSEYRQRILKMRPNIYIDGEVVGRDDPRLQLGINVIAETFDVAAEPELEGVMTATSHLTGEKINRFTNIHRSVEDLLNKQKMTRLYCQRTGGCIQRCMGIDAVNALSVVTYDTDQKYGTEYNKRFINWLTNFQKNDLVGNCAQTDVKGDRSKRPHEQADPDLYLRVVEKKSDGIVVRGAKAHNTCAPYVDEIIAVPTRYLAPDEGDWAVAFAIPADWEGVHLSCRIASPRPRKRLDAPHARYGDVESFTIFDDVFVPWERVFLCGESEFGGRLALLFALYHRHSYCGCKPAVTDIMTGATALAAEYNGVPNAQHVKGKLAELISVAELVYSAGIAAAVTSKAAPSGTYVPDVIYANVGRRHAGLHIYEEHETVADIGGGLTATLPMEGDFYNEVTGPLLEKYIMRNPKISAEDQHRLFRLMGDLICSGAGGVAQIAGIHGGGSPVMEEIAILGGYDIEAKKNLVKRLAGIKY